MSVSISPAVAHSAPAAVSASSTTAQQQAQLNRLLQSYQTDINDGATATTLKPLAKQITDLAKQLDENVTLPTAATATTAAASGSSAMRAVANDHGAKLDITA